MFKRYWWVMLVMLPVGMTVGFLVAAVVTYVMPKKYESTAVIEVKPLARMGVGDEGVSVSPNFFITEFEKIKSGKSLMWVVDSLDLSNRWGMDRESAVEELKRIVTVENLRGTDLISIRVRNTSREDVRDIAAEVARAYKEFREELISELSDKRILELRIAVRKQEDKVEEQRRVLIGIPRKGLYLLDGSTLPRFSDSEKQKYDEAKRDFEVYQDLLDKMRLKLVSEEIEAKIQGDSIIVHDDPVIPNAPVSPNVALNLIAGTIGGLLISPFCALPLMWMMNRNGTA